MLTYDSTVQDGTTLQSCLAQTPFDMWCYSPISNGTTKPVTPKLSLNVCCSKKNGLLTITLYGHMVVANFPRRDLLSQTVNWLTDFLTSFPQWQNNGGPYPIPGDVTTTRAYHERHDPNSYVTDTRFPAPVFKAKQIVCNVYVLYLLPLYMYNIYAVHLYF